jgi:hypothetical protein
MNGKECSVTLCFSGASASSGRATLTFAFLPLLEGLGDGVRHTRKRIHVEREKSVGYGIKNVLLRICEPIENIELAS